MSDVKADYRRLVFGILDLSVLNGDWVWYANSLWETDNPEDRGCEGCGGPREDARLYVSVGFDEPTLETRVRGESGLVYCEDCLSNTVLFLFWDEEESFAKAKVVILDEPYVA